MTATTNTDLAKRAHEARAAFNIAATQCKAAIPSRDAAWEGAFDAVIARQHLILIGEPGEAKSKMARLLAWVLTMVYFEIMLSRGTEPDELWGALDIKAYEQGVRRRIPAGMIQEAQFAFVDEVFKGTSAIRNGMLALANERVYHENGKKLPAPIETIVMATNEIPDIDDPDDEDAAFYDRVAERFLIEAPEDEADLKRILRKQLPEVTATIDYEHVATLREIATYMPVTDGCCESLIAIRHACRSNNIKVSTRRLEQGVSLMQARAARQGDDQVTVRHLSVFRNVLWNKPEQIDEVNNILDEYAPNWLKLLSVQEDLIKESYNEIERAEGMRRTDAARVLMGVMDTLDDVREELGNLITSEPDAASEAREHLAKADAAAVLIDKKVAGLTGSAAKKSK